MTISTIEFVLIATLVLLAFFVYRQRKEIISLRLRADKRQTGAYQIGVSQTRGDLSQVLGSFSVLSDYENLIMLSTTSKQSSFDLLGMKEDSLDFIEFKKKGAALMNGEKQVKRLVDAKKVNYRILDVELPKSIRVEERMPIAGLQKKLEV